MIKAGNPLKLSHFFEEDKTEFIEKQIIHLKEQVTFGTYSDLHCCVCSRRDVV